MESLENVDGLSGHFPWKVWKVSRVSTMSMDKVPWTQWTLSTLSMESLDNVQRVHYVHCQWEKEKFQRNAIGYSVMLVIPVAPPPPPLTWRHFWRWRHIFEVRHQASLCLLRSVPACFQTPTQIFLSIRITHLYIFDPPKIFDKITAFFDLRQF